MNSRDQDEIAYTISTATVLRIVVILALCAAIFMVRDFVLVLLVAVVIASAIEPGTKWFIRRRIPRIPAVILQYVLIAGSLSVLFYFLFLPLISEIVAVAQMLPSYIKSAPSGFTGAGNFQLPQESVQQIANQISNTLVGFSQGFFSTISTIFGGVISLVLIIVLSFYLSVQENGIGRFLSTITPKKYRSYILSLWDRSERKIGRWMQGQLILAVIMFALVFIGLSLFHIQHALLLAVLAGVLEIIPIFGPVIAAIPGITLAFLGDGFSTAVFVTLLYILFQQLENHVVYPLVVKKVIGVQPMVSILAIVIGGKLFGFLGILLSVPAAAIIMEYLNDRERWMKEEEKEEA